MALPGKNFAYISHHRIKTLDWGDASGKKDGPGFGAIGRWAHHVRAVDTPNADPERIAFDRVWCAETDWKGKRLDDGTPLMEKIRRAEYLSGITQAEIKRLRIGRTSKGKEGKIRPDTVWLEELLLSISPEWFRNGRMSNPVDINLRRKFEDLTFKWLKEEFDKNLMAVVSHGDEENPHVGAFVLPAVMTIVHARGRLKAWQVRKRWNGWTLKSSELFSRNIHYKDGSHKLGKCSENQDKYANFLKAHGLDVVRGIRGSDAIHVRMRAHVHQVHYPLPTLPALSLPQPKTLESGKKYHGRIFEEVNEQLEKFNTDITTLYIKANEHDQAAKHRDQYQKTAERERTRREEVQIENRTLRETIRALENRLEKSKGPPVQMPKPIEVITKLLLPAQYRVEADYWELEEARTLKLEGDSFFIFHREKNGENLLSSGQSLLGLVIEITGWTVPVATAWLAEHFGEPCLMKIILSLARGFKPDVKKYHDQFLTETRQRVMNANQPEYLINWLSLTRGYPVDLLRKWHQANILSFTTGKTGEVTVNIELLNPKSKRRVILEKVEFTQAGQFHQPNVTDKGYSLSNSGKHPTKLNLAVPTTLDFLDLVALYPELRQLTDKIVAMSNAQALCAFCHQSAPGSLWLVAIPTKPDEAQSIRDILANRKSTVEFANLSPFGTWMSARDNLKGKYATEAKMVFDHFGERLKVISKPKPKPRQL